MAVRLRALSTEMRDECGRRCRHRQSLSGNPRGSFSRTHNGGAARARWLLVESADARVRPPRPALVRRSPPSGEGGCGERSDCQRVGAKRRPMINATIRVRGTLHESNFPFAPVAAIKQECFYLHDAPLLTDQSKLTNHDPWQGRGNLIVMQPCNGRCPFSGERVMLQLPQTICCVR